MSQSKAVNRRALLEKLGLVAVAVPAASALAACEPLPAREEAIAAGSAALSGPRFVINVQDHGAAGDGVNNDYLAIKTALDDARANRLPLYFPAGVYKVQFPDSLSPFLLDWEDVEIFGDGENTSMLDTSCASGAYDVFRAVPSLAGPRKIWLHDLQVIATYTVGVDTAVLAHRLFTGDAARLHVTVERCRLVGAQNTIITASNAGAVLTLSLRSCKIRSGLLSVSMFSEYADRKELFAKDCEFEGTDPNTGSHILYLHPYVAYDLENCSFRGVRSGKFAIHNWGSGGQARFIRVRGCYFAPDITGVAWLTSEHSPAQGSDCVFECAAGIWIRNSITLSNCVFRPTQQPGASSPVCMTTYGDCPPTAHLSVIGCHFDYSRSPTGQTTAISIAHGVKATIVGCTFSARGTLYDPPIVTNNTFCLSVSGKTQGCLILMADCVCTFSTVSPSTAAMVVVLSPNDPVGTVRIDRCTWVGRVAADRAAIRIERSKTVDRIEVSGCRIHSTGRAIYADAELPSGALRGSDNDFGGAKLNLAADHYLQLRSSWGGSLASAATLDVDASNDRYEVTGNAAISMILLENDALTQRGFGGSVIHLIGNGTWTLTDTGNVAVAAAPAAGEMVSLFYDAGAGKWRRL